MTEKEWKEILRTVKNNKKYSIFIFSVLHFNIKRVTLTKNIILTERLERFKCVNGKDSVLEWYEEYYSRIKNEA